VLFIARRIGLGGMTRQMGESAVGFAERGIATTVLTPEVRGLEAFSDRFAAAGVRVVRVPRLTRATIMPVVEEAKPELVRLVSGTFPPNIALASRLMSEGLPVIETLHAMTMRESLPVVRLFDAGLSPGRRYRAVALSAPMYDECLRRVPALKPWLRVVDYGMPLPDFSDVPERDPLDGARAFRIFTAARLVEDHKDTATLLRAFALLLERLADQGAARERAELRIAGDGRDRAALEALARELGIADRVVFLGWIGDVRAEMRQADVFVLSTKSESFGRVNVEAAAAGTPVVASKVLGCLASVEDGGNGLLVAPGDAGQMAGALALLFGDDVLRERLARRGPEFAARFSMDRHVRSILELAGELLLRRW
jgi:glycosyltransferase involved in cell wall biosynthesis